MTDIGRNDADGDERLPDDMVPLVYDELRRIARHYLSHEKAGHTLQPTALVHEAYLRISKLESIDWKNRGHFCAMASTLMRRILVEHARKARAQKRGDAWLRVTWNEDVASVENDLVEICAVDEALNKLAARHERQARIAELRIFGGLQNAEIAGVLEVSERTVKRDWKVAQAWLSWRLGRPGEEGPVPP